MPLSRREKREELKYIRTHQAAPITKKRLKKRLKKGKQPRAISGALIVIEEEPVKEEPSPYDPTLSLDFEEYPMPTERAPTPRFVKGVEDVWMKYEMTMGKPSEYLRAKATGTLSKAEEAKLSGKHGIAGLLFSAYMFERMGAGVYEGFTLPIRPLALGQTLATTIKLVDPQFRKEVGKAIVADPGGFAAEVAGGFLGGYAFGKGVQYAKVKYQAFKQARFEKKYSVEDFLPYEQEMLAPQPTQDIDLRSSTFEERAEPVIWEYKGGKKPTIPLDQRLPLKEYPDPSRVEIMGGKAITDLVTLEEISKARTVIEPTWIPGLRISDMGPTITKPISGVSPYWAGLLGIAGAIPKISEDTLSKVDRETRIIDLGRTRRRTREDVGVISEPRTITYPIEDVKTITEPTKIVGTGPGLTFMPIQEPVPIHEPISKQTPIQVPISIQEPKPLQELKPRQKTVKFTPPIPIIDVTIIGEPDPFRFRIPKKKKRDRGFWDLVTFGEIRFYPVKGIEKMIKDLKI